MRIAYCSDALPPVADGVTRTLGELVATLRESGVEFLFVSAVKPDAALEWRDRVHTIVGVPFPLYPYYKVGLPIAETLDAVLDRFAPDVVHIVTPSLLGLYGVRYGRRRGIPVVASFHTNFVSLFSYYGLGRLEWLGRRCMRWFYNQCDITLAPSWSTADYLRAHGIKNVGLWQGGVDPERFAPGFRSEALRDQIGADGMPVLLYVGRLAKEKNLHYLVAAVRELRRRGDPFKLVIVGAGPIRAEIEARLPEAYFTGYVKADDVARWYASADLFVFPSTAETFGIVVLEAFASGLPVVGVNGGGIRELVTPSWNGFLAPPHEPAAFAELVHSLLQQPAVAARLGAQARATAAGYRWPDVNRRLLDCYEQVIRAHARAEEVAEAVALADPT